MCERGRFIMLQAACARGVDFLCYKWSWGGDV